MSQRPPFPADPSWGKRSDLRVINTDIPRIDGPVKNTGLARYTHDIRLPDMLYARVLRSPLPAAQVTLDLEAAKQIEGVAIAIPLDVERVRYLGQPVAAVAAETPELAEDAIRAIEAKFEELPWAVDWIQSTRQSAPPVSDRLPNVSEPNISGDAEATEKALETCDAVIEGTYVLPVQHHTCLETHGVVVDYRGGEGATVYASTQGTFTVPGEAADILGLPGNQVHSIVQHMGGGFGAKFGLDLPGQIACRLAKEVERPIHLMFTRTDEFLTAGNRSGARHELKGGANQDGKLVALHSRVDRLGGIGRGSHPGLPYIYSVESAYTEMRSVLTNTDGSRAFRAPGHPQASFGMESIVDELAYAVGVDPLTFRKNNLEDPVYHRQLDRVAKEIGWEEHPNKTSPGQPDAEGLVVGIGFGVSTWGGGGRPACEVDVMIERDGSVTAECGTQDLGTGTRTLMAAIVAEELGLLPADIVVRIGHSRLGRANASGGSTTAASLSPAVKVAAHKVREALLDHVASALDSKMDRLKIEPGGTIVDQEDSTQKIDWKSACASLGPNGIQKRGEFEANLQASGVHGAQAAKVQIDTLTGELKVLKVVAIQDCGLPINRLALRSQINGGVIQALSYGMFEQRVLDRDLGLQLNADLDNYKIIGIGEVPEIVALIDDDDERQAVIGIGEPPAIPGQSLLANAIFNACGVRLREMPFTPDKILMGLEALRSQEEGR